MRTNLRPRSWRGFAPERKRRGSPRKTFVLDQPAFNRKRLKAEKLINSKVLEQLIRVQVDAGCSSTTLPRAAHVRKAAGSPGRPEAAAGEARPMGLAAVDPIRYSCEGAPVQNNPRPLRSRPKAPCRV